MTSVAMHGMTTDVTLRRLLRGSVALAIAAAAASLVALAIGQGVARIGESDVPFALLLSIGFGGIVWVGAGQQPTNRLIWALSIFVASMGVFALGVAIRAGIAPEVPPRLSVDTYVPAEIPPAAAWVEMIALAVASAGQDVFLIFGLLLFPNGRLPSRRWQPVAVIGGVTIVAGSLLNLVVWHPSSTSIIMEHPLFHVMSPFDLGLPLLALASVVLRYRRADHDERTRIKWVIWGVNLAIPLILAATVAGSGPVIASALLLLVAAYGIAISKHHLFDVDVVISRTLVYVSLAVFIGVVYVAVVVGVGSLLGSGDEPNAVLSVAATSLVAVAFQPVRRRLERVANRLVFGRKATPYEVLSEFSRRVAATSDGLLEEAAHSLAEGTRAERVAISMMIEGEPSEAAAWPRGTTPGSFEPVSFRIADGDTALGSLDLYLPSGQQLQDDDRRLAEQLASGMGLALRNQLLTERLEARVEELRDSRRRLVAVQDETRRRLERDLHDGAQQQLVALKVKLGLSKAIAEKDGATQTAELLGRLSREADQAVDAMREFARGVYPPLLEAEGLASAIAAQARRAPIPVSVDSDGIGRYPREIESTVYFCVLEAVRNTIQHADATQARVNLTQANGALEFQVTDDGTGFDRAISQGVGLTAMADRLDALAGDLTIHTEPGNGTTLTGVIPAPAEVPA